VQGGAHCLFTGCTVRRCAGNGIEIRGGQHHGLAACDIYSMGRGGTLVSGGDRRTLVPGEHFVVNCDIHDLSRIDHTYTPAVLLEGVGHRVAHNRMHGIGSSAMRVEGNNNLIEYNEIYDVVTESDDQGAVDMFGNPTYRGNVYRYNYFHHIGNWRARGEQPKCGQAGIRLDDAICGTLIYGNVFERCSAGKLGFGGVQIHGGKDNIIENNLFVDCAAAISFSPWDSGRWRQFVKAALASRDVDRELYLQRYPELARLSEDPNLNHIRRNLVYRCGELFRRPPKNLDASDNAVLPETEFAWEPPRFQLHRPGFDPIPWAEIGMYVDAPFRPR
jgi:Right handed beta helix region